MAAPKRGPRLGAGPKHQRLLLANLASELFVHGRIQTTETKAKNLRPYAEKLITKAKQGDLHARRQVLSKLRDRDVVAYLFEEVAPRFGERNGGYTRILKLGPRKGDGASMALIELTELGAFGEGEEFVEEGRARRARGLFGRLRRGRGGGDGDGDVLHDEDVEELGEAEVADQVDVEPDDLAEDAEAGEPEPIAEVADEDSPVDSLAEARDETAADTPAVDDEADVEKDAAAEPPDQPTVGEPVDETGDDADAGEASGKDAGS